VRQILHVVNNHMIWWNCLLFLLPFAIAPNPDKCCGIVTKWMKFEFSQWKMFFQTYIMILQLKKYDGFPNQPPSSALPKRQISRHHNKACLRPFLLSPTKNSCKTITKMQKIVPRDKGIIQASPFPFTQKCIIKKLQIFYT
jgi:hypothetical protein